MLTLLTVKMGRLKSSMSIKLPKQNDITIHTIFISMLTLNFKSPISFKLPINSTHFVPDFQIF